MRSKLLFLGLLLTATQSFSQNISGRLIDEESKPVEFANIVLLSLPDSTFLQGTISDTNGIFQLPSDGKTERLLCISCIGYTNLYRRCIAENLGDVPLKLDTQVLDEVVVKASLPATRLRGDALVTNVQAGVLAKAGSANDVLGKIPGIIRQDKNSFEVFGKGAPLIYINGRQMRDASELESLRSEDIKEVELITNPGARYDSTVKSVIRIKTIRRQGDGFGFDLRSSWYQWDQTDLTEEVRLNYRHNGLDVFGSYNYYSNENYRFGLLAQTIYADKTWTQTNHITEHKKRSQTHASEIGFNYQIAENHSVGARYKYETSPASSSHLTILSDISCDEAFYDHIDNEIFSVSGTSPSHRLNAYYNGRLGDLEIDFNADYFGNKTGSASHYVEQSQNYDDRDFGIATHTKNRLVAAKLVFTYPVLGGNLNWGAEYTYTHRNDDNVNPDNYVPTTYSLIKEDNIGGFAEYSRQLLFGRIAAGVRFEHVSFGYFEEKKQNNNQSRVYNNWFPNFSFGSTLGKVNMQLSYTAKTMRPSYRQLSNMVVYANRFTAETGNPKLKPALTHDVSLTASWKFLQASVAYQQTIDPVFYWSRPVEGDDGAAMLYYVNYDKLPSLRFFAAASPTIGWWSPRISVGVNKQWLTMKTDRGMLKLNKPVWTLSLSNSFKLPAGVLFNVDYRLRGKGYNESYYLGRTGHLLGASLRKSFLNDTFDVTLGMSDILYKNQPFNSTYSPYMQMSMDNRFDTREAYMTLRYRFNSGKNKYKGTGAGADALRRL